MTDLYSAAIADLSKVFNGFNQAQVDRALDVIAGARRIAFYGCGREGLQLRGFCMRLFHMGLNVAMVGDMTTPAVGKGDLLIVSSGPGNLNTGNALITVAKQAGAEILVITAQLNGPTPKSADHVVVVPAQTMANDSGPAMSVLPMGSLFEGAEFILFEVMVLQLRDKLGVTSDQMRARHTNLE